MRKLIRKQEYSSVERPANPPRPLDAAAIIAASVSNKRESVLLKTDVKGPLNMSGSTVTILNMSSRCRSNNLVRDHFQVSISPRGRMGVVAAAKVQNVEDNLPSNSFETGPLIAGSPGKA